MVDEFLFVLVVDENILPIVDELDFLNVTTDFLRQHEKLVQGVGTLMSLKIFEPCVQLN